MRTNPATAASTPPRPSARERGFSLLEVLIAAALFLVIAVGLVPLFTRSMLNNILGNESTEASTFAISQIESPRTLPMDHQDLRITSGLSRATQEFYEMQWMTEGAARYFVDVGWTTTAPAADLMRWRRDTTVQQFHMSDLQDDQILKTPLAAGTSPFAVSFKVITVQLTNPRTQQQRMIARWVKAIGPSSF